MTDAARTQRLDQWRRDHRRLLRGVTGLVIAAGSGVGGLAATSGGASAAALGRARLTAFAPEQRPLPAVIGTVRSVDAAGNSFVVEGPAGRRLTVEVSATTTYRDPAVHAPALSNVTVGEHVVVFGTTSSSTVNATTVLIGMRGPLGINPGGPMIPVGGSHAPDPVRGINPGGPMIPAGGRSLPSNHDLPAA
jgi:hypothetical protein